MKVTYVTGNKNKFKVAQKVLAGLGIEVVQEAIETPEIQSTEVEDIAKYSAQWAAEKLAQPVVLTDAGYYIEALNGFPGPFIKYTNKWLTADDYLRLMEGKKNRTIIVKACLAYCEPGKEPVTFLSQARATMALAKGKPGTTPINEVYIPEGYDRVESELTREVMVVYWSRFETHWNKFAEYLSARK